jgi:phosphoribosylamine--glycine ligase
MVDALRASGIPAFGPTAAAARIESSKVFAKQLMHDAGVPTARAERHTHADQAVRAVHDFGAPVVIKAPAKSFRIGSVGCVRKRVPFIGRYAP